MKDASFNCTVSRKLSIMLAELESNSLQVCLAPSKRGRNETDCIRVCLSKNARWYSQFCGRFLSSRVRVHRKPDTLIKRQHTIRALERMIKGDLRGRYAERILEAARKLPA